MLHFQSLLSTSRGVADKEAVPPGFPIERERGSSFKACLYLSLRFCRKSSSPRSLCRASTEGGARFVIPGEGALKMGNKISQGASESTVTAHGAPRGRKVCIQWGVAWFLDLMMYIYTAIDYCSAMQPSALCLPHHLGHTSVCHGNPLQGVPSTPATTSRVTRGTDGEHVSE